MIRSSLLHRPGSVTIIGQLQIVVHIWIKIFLKSHLDFSASVISQQILLCIALRHFEISYPIIQFQMRVSFRCEFITGLAQMCCQLSSINLQIDNWASFRFFFIVLLTIFFHFKIADTSQWIEIISDGTFSNTPKFSLHFHFLYNLYKKVPQIFCRSKSERMLLHKVFLQIVLNF